MMLNHFFQLRKVTLETLFQKNIDFYADNTDKPV